MADLIVAVILILIVGAAVRYIVKQKKSGAHCIGCPSGGNCIKACNCQGKAKK
ncbi:MAG: FeoB-associated Cys-rich membrane protein [Lachnospiraceae bacterium]|nr:FeoB-associated Cys-rich membrane protein [Lachnospiraceae bacterium]